MDLATPEASLLGALGEDHVAFLSRQMAIFFKGT